MNKFFSFDFPSNHFTFVTLALSSTATKICTRHNTGIIRQYPTKTWNIGFSKRFTDRNLKLKYLYERTPEVPRILFINIDFEANTATAIL